MKKLLILALSAVGTSAMAVTFGPGASFNIPDTSPTSGSSTINVSGQPPTVGSLNWVAVDFNTTGTGLSFPSKHTWAGDLIVQLRHVGSGTTVHLFSRVGSTTAGGVGDSSDLAGRYRFFETGASFSAAATAATSTTAIANGDYARSSHAFGAGAGNNANGIANFNGNTFASFSGLALNDNWTLEIWDSASGDVGTVDSWSFDVTPVPEPATMAILGMGALALIRRRKASK